MKKHITRLLFAALLLLALCIGASAAGTSGKCGPSAYWSFDSSTGTLTISGSGEAPVFTSADDQPWAAVREQITEVWFEDVRSAQAKFALLPEYGLLGLGYWNFMRPFAAGFSLQNYLFSIP